MYSEQINEFEAGMLDAILEAFGDTNQLIRTQILELFGKDADLSDTLIGLLADEELITISYPIRSSGGNARSISLSKGDSPRSQSPSGSLFSNSPPLGNLRVLIKKMGS